MTNPICQALGIRYPILLGGMFQVGTAPLAAAVSEAGGFGILGAGAWKKDQLRAQIDAVRKLTDKPFGVNIVVRSPLSGQQVEVVIEEKLRGVTTSAGNPNTYTARLKESGIYVMHVVPTVGFAMTAEKAGVDAVVAEGSESGGFTSLEEISTFVLVPQVVDAVRVPVLAAGGIGDGRGFAAALALGAVAVQVGTVFLATEEAEASRAYKQALLLARDTDTRLVRSSGAGQRRIRDELLQRVAESLDSEADWKGLEADGEESADWEEHLKMKKVPKVMAAGQVAGMVKEIVPVKTLIDGMVQGAQKIFGPDNDRFELTAMN
ncbi:MAG: nitronate monooxygenase [Proteobacteria bacterium]|nr:nitronate monooxygenase [Pseudomonadota bacterium]